MTDPKSHDGPRRCSQCGEQKAAEEFGSGDAYRCLACIRARIATWRLRRRQTQNGPAAGAEATARAKRAVCGRAAATERGKARAPEAAQVRELIADREARARQLQQRLRELEPERREAARRLALTEGHLRNVRDEADQVNREIAELDRRLAAVDDQERQYVRTADLADMLRPAIDRHGGIVAVAQRTGVDRRALRGILDQERPLTTLRLADLICTRLGLDLSELTVMTRSAALST